MAGNLWWKVLVSVAALVFAMAGSGRADGWTLGKYMAEPNPVLRITEALLASASPRLAPELYQDGGRDFSSSLVSVRYLGTLSRGAETVAVATAFFVRSSAKGSEMPTARGHGFVLCLDAQWKIVSVCGLDFPDAVILTGEKLVRTVSGRGESEGGEEIGDLSETGVAARKSGFLIDHSNFLPYPFSDRIPEDSPSGKK